MPNPAYTQASLYGTTAATIILLDNSLLVGTNHLLRRGRNPCLALVGRLTFTALSVPCLAAVSLICPHRRSLILFSIYFEL